MHMVDNWEVSETDIKGIGNMKLRFIRAPYVESFVPEVEVLGTVQNKIIAVKYKNQIAVSFHPELTDDCRIHRQFIQLIKNI